MKIEELSPEPKQRVLFKRASYKFVPAKGGCYALATFEAEILYIGLSQNLNSRFIDHLNSPVKTSPTSQGKVIWFYFVEFDSKNLPKLERTWLHQFQGVHGQLPILNFVNSPIS